MNNGEASNSNVKDNEADVLNKLIPSDCKMEFFAFPIHLGDNEVVLQVSLEVPACYIKEGIEYIHAVFKNNDALLVEKLDLSDLSFDLKKTRAAMQVTDRVIYSNPEVRSSVKRLSNLTTIFSWLEVLSGVQHIMMLQRWIMTMCSKLISLQVN